MHGLHLEDASFHTGKRCGNNNKDEDNSPKTLNDKNHQGSSQKFSLLKKNWLRSSLMRRDTTRN